MIGVTSESKTFLGIPLKRGITREVLLIGKYAFKFPSFRSWWLFLEGLQCNMNELQRQRCSEHFCPILFKLPGGFLIVMPRATETSLTDDEYEEFRKINELHCYVERKDCSFGILKGKLTAVDYGS